MAFLKKLSLAGVFFFYSAVTVWAFSLSPKEMVIPVDETQTLKVITAKDTSYTVDVYNRDIVSFSTNKDSNEIYLKGLASGQTILMVVNSKGDMSACRIIVKEKAGLIPSVLKIKVSGTPSNKETIFDAIAYNLKLNSKIQDQAKLSILTANFNETMQNNEWAIARVQSQITGENYYDVTQNTKIIIENQATDLERDDYLFISNNPEVTAISGKLFQGYIEKNKSARLLYHHGNLIGGEDKVLNIYLTNPTTRPMSVWVTNGVGGPSIDSIFIGHIATKRYLLNVLQKLAYVLEIPPQKSIVLISQRLPTGQYVSGLLKFKLVSGDNLEVAINAENAKYKSLDDLPFVTTDNVKSHVRGKIHLGNWDTDIQYLCSEQYASFEIGGIKQEKLTESNQKLAGNYGLLYTYNVEIKNNLSRTQKVELAVVPRGGFARGCFLINNQFVETRLLDPLKAEEGIIYTLDLQPDEERQIRMITLPQSGSYYPVRLVIRSPLWDASANKISSFVSLPAEKLPSEPVF